MLYCKWDCCINLLFWWTNICFFLYLTTFCQIFRFLRVRELTLFLLDFTGTLEQCKRQPLRPEKSCDCYFPINTCVCVCVRAYANNVKANTCAKYIRRNSRACKSRSYIMREFLAYNVLWFCLFRWVYVFPQRNHVSGVEETKSGTLKSVMYPYAILRTVSDSQ